MITRRGISYDLNSTPYNLELGCSCGPMILSFSSQSHKQKYISRMNGLFNKSAAAPVSDPLRARYKLNVFYTTIDLVVLYMKIETRGFNITVKGVAASCPEQLTFTDHVQIKP